MSNISEKTINHLLTKVSDLESEVERQERIINSAINYIENNDMYIGAFNAYFEPLLEILYDKKKEEKNVIRKSKKA